MDRLLKKVNYQEQSTEHRHTHSKPKEITVEQQQCSLQGDHLETFINVKKVFPRDFLSGLRLCARNAGGLGSIPNQETRSHMPQLKIPHVEMKIKEPAWCD